MHQRTLRTGAVALTAAAALLTPTLAAGDDGHGTMDPATHTAPSSMRVTATVKRDPMKGHNLFLKVRGLRWAPEDAGGAHVQGEGHAHLYVDGKKVTRLYGPAYYLGELTRGKHVVKVTLNGNDHGDFVRHGKPVAASTSVTVR